MTNNSLTLFELNALVRRTVELQMNREYWVQAEISEARESRGHCYMELIEKDGHNPVPIAKASARCWRNTWMLLAPYFERTTGQTLHAGMKVLLKVYPQFHEAYGFSWIVTDIDPTYTMGDMARRRQEIINQLKAEGVFDLQKELPIPMCAQRIAVISAATAAGYGDFCNQLADNEYGFRFVTQLFEAAMQGEQVETSVIAALDRINEQIERFDVVVIIRGGGATSDLSGFDTLALAENVANFPLPIITGIGHERDESILDIISNTRVKTPTAAAAFLIQHQKKTLDHIESAQTAVINRTGRLLAEAESRIDAFTARIPAAATMAVAHQKMRLQRLSAGISAAAPRRLQSMGYRLDATAAAIKPLVKRILTGRSHQLAMLQQRVAGLDPALLLKRGYSITTAGGKTVRDPKMLKPGDELETRMEKGTVKSTVKHL
jgi:exodeoxyribonuclease VII large subunit